MHKEECYASVVWEVEGVGGGMLCLCSLGGRRGGGGGVGWARGGSLKVSKLEIPHPTPLEVVH